MRTLCILFGLAALTPCASAQALASPYSVFLLASPESAASIDLDGITATASRSLTLPADEAEVTVSASVPLGVTLPQVLLALNGTGIQASDIQYQDGTYFDFEFRRPIASFKALIAQLDQISTNMPAGIELYYNASLMPSDAAVEALRQTVIPQLVTEAKRKAQSMANAANLVLGPVQSISDGGTAGAAFLTDLNFGGRLGGVILVGTLAAGDLQATYTVTARFAVQ